MNVNEAIAWIRINSTFDSINSIGVAINYPYMGKVVRGEIKLPQRLNADLIRLITAKKSRQV